MQNRTLRTLVDRGNHLSHVLGLRERPFAILVDHDLTLLAEPSQTSPKVQRLITLLATSAQNAPKSFLTLDPDASARQPEVAAH